ncbi:hypothetical protein AGLY_004172 [Aphis glycines]|uniref:Uncharacterized protein n=1 Tax=Aphis glycines TaxID=307491 RepID=A0A6G0TZS4_APHGL|nr:hypothetical protein AGLY_004172 [Aphis glycines]
MNNINIETDFKMSDKIFLYLENDFISTELIEAYFIHEIGTYNINTVKKTKRNTFFSANNDARDIDRKPTLLLAVLVILVLYISKKILDMSSGKSRYTRFVPTGHYTRQLELNQPAMSPTNIEVPLSLRLVVQPNDKIESGKLLVDTLRKVSASTPGLFPGPGPGKISAFNQGRRFGGESYTFSMTGEAS